MGTMTFKADLVPNTDLGYSLGSAALKWKINGVADPKLTDTVTTVTTTGSGNAITAINASNGAITATKGTTFSTTDTKNTAGSSDTSSKIFLVGATSQASSAQTYSDNQVYATNGQLDANTMRIGEHAILQYNTSS